MDQRQPEIKRWQYRLLNLKQAFTQFQNAIELAKQRELSPLEKQGVVQSFEFTHELAWNTMRDFLLESGMQNLFGSKDTTREAFQKGLIGEGESWMKMIEHRNLSSHTYKVQTAEEIIMRSVNDYGRLIGDLINRLESLASRGELES